LMCRWRRYVRFRSITRVGRLAATLTVVPALVLNSLTAQAILIHDHHGHDTHSHALSVHELDELERNPEHQHEEHEHDAPAVDLADAEGSSLVIVLDLPEGLARSRVLSSNGTAVAGRPFAPSTNVVAIVTQQPDRSCTERPSSSVPPVRARGLLEGILLTSHALLL
jgi:hypothetical protein